MLKFFATFTLCSAVIGASLISTAEPADAESHVPSLDIEPTAIFSTSGDITPTPGVPTVNGTLLLNGSIHVPILKQLTFSYDHITNGLIYGSLPRVAIGGAFVKSPLEFRDYLDTFRLDGSIARGLNAELGTTFRHRVCCPADSDPTNSSPSFYHDNYLSLSYSTPAIAVLHNASLTYSVTGHASPHNSDTPAAVAAANALGYPDERRTEYGITQAATLAVPIDAAHGFVAAGTYTWGAFNYFSNQPIPLYYGIYVISVTKIVNKYLSFTASSDNFVQRPQGYPFPLGSGVNGASLNVTSDIHLGL